MLVDMVPVFGHLALAAREAETRASWRLRWAAVQASTPPFRESQGTGRLRYMRFFSNSVSRNGLRAKFMAASKTANLATLLPPSL